MDGLLGWLLALVSGESLKRSRYDDPWTTERKSREREIIAAAVAVGLCIIMSLALAHFARLAEQSQHLRGINDVLQPAATYLLAAGAVLTLLWLLVSVVTYVLFIRRAR